MARRKKTIVKKSDKITEYEGWSAGDIVYTTINGTAEIRYGEVTAFYPRDNMGPAFGFIDWADGKHRVALIEWIVEKPTTKQKRKAERKR